MRAWVEDRANGITYLPVEGPTVALVWKVTNRGNPTALFAMRVWAQTLNLQALDSPPQRGMSAYVRTNGFTSAGAGPYIWSRSTQHWHGSRRWCTSSSLVSGVAS